MNVMVCLADALQLLERHSVCPHNYLFRYFGDLQHLAKSSFFLWHLCLQDCNITAGVTAHALPLMQDQIRFLATVTRKCSYALLEFICFYEISVSLERP